MLKQLGKSPAGLLGAIIIVSVILVAIASIFVSPYPPKRIDLESRFIPPGREHLLGTDQLGRDVLSRIFYGSRISVFVGIVASLFSGMIGVTLGLAAGFWPRYLGTIIMWLVDTRLAIPFLILVVALAGVLGPGIFTIVLVLGVTGWATFARISRSQVLTVKQEDFVISAEASGASNARILFRHILPNTVAPVIVVATLSVATAILAESSLSFLGLGVQPPEITWGLMLSSGRKYIATAWWLALFPGLSITITVLGVVLLGDWIRDTLDPRLRHSR